MMSIRFAFCLLMAVLIGGGAWRAAADDSVVRRQGNRLMLNGREYRAMGVNMPHLLWVWQGTWIHIAGNDCGSVYPSQPAARAAIETAVAEAAESGAAFIRFFANPGVPREIAALYDKDPQRYWRQTDQLMDLCRKHHLRVVPCLYPPYFSWHLLYGETADALADPSSQTHAAVMQYIRQFVARYKDDPVVLAWELSNEPMLEADVDWSKEGGDERILYKEIFPPGSPFYRDRKCRKDGLSWAAVLRIVQQQAALVKSLDPQRPLSSGEGYVRPECTSRRETFPNFKFRNDTFSEWLANNLLAQPQPLDFYSFHIYGYPGDPEPNSPWPLAAIEKWRSVVRAAHATGRPVFVGELGQEKPSFREDPEAKWTLQAIDMLESENVSLIALWVWHFPWQPDRTLSLATHPRLVERMAAFNRRYAQ